MRARLALFHTGITFELREIVLRDKPADMLQISPKGTVPVLWLPNGAIIDESFDIMLWALQQNDPDSWLDYEYKTLITQNDGPFKKFLDRYKYPNRYPDEDCSNARENARSILEKLNDRLTQHEYLCGNHPSLADMAIFPFIRQFANVDREWWAEQNMKPLQQWLVNHLESDLFLSIMDKYTPWKNGDTPRIIQDGAAV